MKRRGPGRGRSPDDARFLHGREFFLSSCQLLRVKSLRFSKNRRTRVGEKKMSHYVMRFRSRKTSGNSSNSFLTCWVADRKATLRKAGCGPSEALEMTDSGQSTWTTRRPLMSTRRLKCCKKPSMLPLRSLTVCRPEAEEGRFCSSHNLILNVNTDF